MIFAPVALIICLFTFKVKYCRVPCRLGFHQRRSPQWCSLSVFIYWRLESYCGRMGAGCRWFGSIWGGIVGVFSVVAGWFGGVFRGAWNAIVSVFGGLAGWFRGIWNAVGWYFGSVGVYRQCIGGAFRGSNGVLGFMGGLTDLSTDKLGDRYYQRYSWRPYSKIPNLNIPQLAEVVTPPKATHW